MKKSLQFLYLSAAALVIPSPAAPLEPVFTGDIWPGVATNLAFVGASCQNPSAIRFRRFKATFAGKIATSTTELRGEGRTNKPCEDRLLTYPKAIPVSIQDPTEELTATGNGSSTLVFPQVGLSSRVEHYPARTQTLMAAGIGTTLLNLAIVPAADGTITAGQTYDVVPNTAGQGGPSVTPNSAEVRLDATPTQPLSRSTWRGAGGTVTIISFTRGSIAPGKPGVFQVRFNDVKMVPTSVNPVKDPFVLKGPLVADTGGTPEG